MRFCVVYALALLAATAGTAQPLVASAGDATVRGVVRDNTSGEPVPGAQVWLAGTRYGAVTDSAGSYSVPWSGNGGHRLYARICGREDAATGWADRREMDGDVASVDFEVDRPAVCDPLLRPPWAVGLQDTTSFVGHLVYSWEGTHGGFLVPCSGGESLGPQWRDGTVLWDSRPEEGARQFVRLLGRYDEDYWEGGPTHPVFSGSEFYVRQVVEKRPAAVGDCSQE